MLRRCALLAAFVAIGEAVPPAQMRQKLMDLGKRQALGARPVPPTWVQSWAVANSLATYACNYSGFFEPAYTRQFSLIALDWSTGKQAWANQHPMDAEQLMVDQVNAIEAARPGTISLVYRNTVKALAWFSHVREKLADPAYAGFFLPYSPAVPAPQSPACDAAFDPPRCTALFHDQMQSPQFNVSDDGQNGTCFTGCDAGAGVPSGEYLWDLRNASARAYVLENILGPTALGHPSITGLYLGEAAAAAVPQLSATAPAPPNPPSPPPPLAPPIPSQR